MVVLKKLISKIFSLFNLSLIQKDKLIKLDVERKRYRYEYEKLDFLFLNERIKNPKKLYDLIDLSESQIFQDLFVINELDFKENGYFVEIGAADGKYLSNTYLLENQFKWDGLVVEPAKIWSKDINKNRNCSISYDCVHSMSNVSIEFNQAEKPEFSRANVSNNIPSDTHEYLRDKNNTVYMLKTISINDLFKKYNVNKNIHYLSIDTEGTEFEILKSLDFKNYDISIISVEHNFTSNREKIYNLLTNNGFVRVQEKYSKFDDWYIKRKD